MRGIGEGNGCEKDEIIRGKRGLWIMESESEREREREKKKKKRERVKIVKRREIGKPITDFLAQ